jgi:ribosomal protein S18 acetylase RimI-like enzyme
MSGDEVADGIELAKTYASQLLALDPAHELLQYFELPNQEEWSEEKIRAVNDRLFNRFWNKNGPWRSAPRSRVTAYIYGQYVVDLRKAVIKINAAQVTLRTANQSDYGPIRNLLRQSDQYHHELQPDDFKDPSEFVYLDRIILNAMSGGDNATIVAICGGTVVGFVQVGIRRIESVPSLMHPTNGFVYDIAVDVAYEGHGIGTKLVYEAIAWAKRKGMETIELDVREGNQRALRIYEKSGFVKYLNCS